MIPQIIVGASVELVLPQPCKNIPFDIKVSWVGWLEPKRDLIIVNPLAVISHGDSWLCVSHRFSFDSFRLFFG
jgi:hypothetical protein